MAFPLIPFLYPCQRSSPVQSASLLIYKRSLEYWFVLVESAQEERPVPSLPLVWARGEGRGRLTANAFR